MHFCAYSFLPNLELFNSFVINWNQLASRHCLPFFISKFHCDTHFIVGIFFLCGQKLKYFLKPFPTLSLRNFVNNSLTILVLLFNFQSSKILFLLNQFPLLFFLALYLLFRPFVSKLLFGAGQKHFHICFSFPDDGYI